MVASLGSLGPLWSPVQQLWTVGFCEEAREEGAVWGCWAGFKEYYEILSGVLAVVPPSGLPSGKAKVFFQTCRPGYRARGGVFGVQSMVIEKVLMGF